MKPDQICCCGAQRTSILKQPQITSHWQAVHATCNTSALRKMGVSLTLQAQIIPDGVQAGLAVLRVWDDVCLPAAGPLHLRLRLAAGARAHAVGKAPPTIAVHGALASDGRCRRGDRGGAWRGLQALAICAPRASPAQRQAAHQCACTSACKNEDNHIPQPNR